MAILGRSQCESVPFEHDVQGLHLSRSVVDTCTKFLACMVDTQDYVCQLKNTYVKELWPKLCAEMTELNSKVIGLEKELANCNKEKEESQLYYMEQFEKLQMAKDGQRSHLIREVESPDHYLIREGRRESKVDSEGALEREASNHAVNFEVLYVEHEKQNQLLLQRIEAYSKSNNELSTTNQDLRKQLRALTDEIEELKKALELVRLKQQIREQKRSLQEDSEDRYKRERRLSLKKQRNSQSKSGSPFGPWRGEQGVDERSLTDWQAIHDPGLLQSVSNIPSNVGELYHNDTPLPVMKLPSSSPKNIRCLAPRIKRIDLEVDDPTRKGKLPHDPIDTVIETEEKLHPSKFEKHAKGNATIRECKSALRSPSSEAPETTLGSFLCENTEGSVLRVDAEQPKAHPVLYTAHQAGVPAIATELLEPVSAKKSEELCAAVSCDSGRHKDSGNETSGLHSVSRVSGELASSRAKQCSSTDTGSKKQQETIKNLAGHQSGTGTVDTAGKKIKQRNWRDTRSRTAKGEDLHDSFLNTPRELIMANLKSRGDSTRIQHEDPLKCSAAELRQQPKVVGPSPTSSSSSKGRKEADMATPYEWTDDSKLEDKKSVRTKASAGKSAWPVEGAENVEKKLGQYPAARRNCSDKEKKDPICKAPAFKFNEPVRKKRDREQLESTDCIQCKKFYDAVLAEDAEGVTMDRCEHHDAVSRHRYKYLPPGTPAGFWNIGFDTES